MSTTNRPLTFTAGPAVQHLLAELEERLQMNRSAIMTLALVEMARREGLSIPDERALRRAAQRRPQGRLIADPPGPIGGHQPRA